MMDKVRVGVVGTSWWADALYFPSLKTHPRAILAAICGRNRARAQEMADKYNIAQVFTDYRDMLAGGNLHAIIIAVPDDLHYAMTMDALDAGLHVLCEKPLALNRADAKALYEKANVLGVRHMVMFTWRWMPQFQYLHELVEQGFVGRCFQAEFQFRSAFGRNGAYNWRFNQRRANGVVGDLGSHVIDLARWLVGDIASVSAQLSTFVERSTPKDEPFEPANDSIVLALKFANGAQGTAQLSQVTKVTRGQMQLHIALYGEAGALEADLQTDGEIRGARIGEDAQVIPVPDYVWGDADKSDGWDVLFKNSTGARYFIDAIVEDRLISPSFYDGYKAQQVIDAAIESDRSGCWVSIQ